MLEVTIRKYCWVTITTWGEYFWENPHSLLPHGSKPPSRDNRRKMSYYNLGKEVDLFLIYFRLIINVLFKGTTTWSGCGLNSDYATRSWKTTFDPLGHAADSWQIFRGKLGCQAHFCDAGNASVSASKNILGLITIDSFRNQTGRKQSVNFLRQLNSTHELQFNWFTKVLSS